MERYYKIGDFTFMVHSERDLLIPPHFSLFEISECDYEVEYYLHLVDELPEIDGKVVHNTSDLIVTEKDGQEKRKISLYNMYDPYAVYKEKDNKHVDIFLKNLRVDEILLYDTTFTSMFALEKRMAERNSLILHSCSVTYGDHEAILFSAPSGTGKSTQGEQWRKYRGSRVINGDRNLLTKIDGFWYMRGWPICGSSEICHNEEYKIKAIVMLEQAPEDEVSLLTGMKAYSRIFPEITCSRWNKSRALWIMNEVDILVNDVPIYLLKCTISENAVNTLENEIVKL